MATGNEEKQPSKKTTERTPALSDRRQELQETPFALQGNTSVVGNTDNPEELLNELSPDERVQAKAALAFLGEVRDESRPRSVSNIPQRVGRYSIIRSIGRGGFAEVFLAEDEELNRRVALKIPLFDSSRNDSFRQRFEREAKLAASLGHPQIVPVFEYGDLGPVRYIAFAWCDGPNLSQWIAKNGRVSATTAAQIIKHLAEAVQHAHQRGIVHRDLKPANILVDASAEISDEPVWRRLRITDFGLARNFEASDTTLTQDGQLVGTPAYMSPEQARAEADVREASDIYALGVILYELLTGKVPFRGDNHLATLRKVEREPMLPPRKVDPSIAKDLDAICQKCLSKAPSDRYTTAYDLAEELNAFLENRPVKVRPPGPLLRLSRWAVNNQKLAASMAFAITCLVVGLGLSLWQWNIANNESIRASKETARANKEAERAVAEADRASSHLSSMFKAIDLMLADNKVTHQAEVPDSQKQLLMEIVNLQREIATDREAEKFTLQQLESISRVARIHKYLGQYDKCKDLVDECMPLFDKLDFASPEFEDIETVWRRIERIFHASIFAHRRMNDPDGALHAIDEFEKLVDRAKPHRHELKTIELRLYLMQQKGNVKYRTLEIKESVAFHQESCAFASEFLPLMSNPMYLDALGQRIANGFSTLARSQYMANDCREAYKSALTSIEVMELYCDKHPSNTSVEKNLALLYMNASCYVPNPGAQAKQQLDQSISIFESIIDRFPSDTYSKEVLANGYITTVSLMRKMRTSAPTEAITTKEALSNLDKVKALVEKGLLDSKDGRAKYLHSLNSKVLLLLELDQPELALEVAKEGCELVKQFELEKDPGEAQRHYVFRALQDLANCQIATGADQDVLLTTSEIRRLIANENTEPGPMTTLATRRQSFMLWALKEETEALERLERFNECVDRIRERIEIAYVDGQWAGQHRYYSGLKQIAKTLSLWRQSDSFSPNEYQDAMTQGIEWIGLALDTKQISSLSKFESEIWDPFRDDKRFVEILQTYKVKNP